MKYQLIKEILIETTVFFVCWNIIAIFVYSFAYWSFRVPLLEIENWNPGERMTYLLFMIVSFYFHIKKK